MLFLLSIFSDICEGECSAREVMTSCVWPFREVEVAITWPAWTPKFSLCIENQEPIAKDEINANTHTLVLFMPFR